METKYKTTKRENNIPLASQSGTADLESGITYTDESGDMFYVYEIAKNGNIALIQKGNDCFHWNMRCEVGAAQRVARDLVIWMNGSSHKAGPMGWRKR